MTISTRTPLSIAVVLGLLSSTQVSAAGFQLAEYSATGLGRAFAGEAAMADNASAQWRNPAMLTYLEGTQVSGGVLYVDPNIDVKGTSSTQGYTEAKDIAHSAPIPNLYISHQINDQYFVGLALGSNYGMETELDDSFLATQFGNQAKVMTVEAVASLGYKINEQFSIGGGIRFVTGEGHFGASVPQDAVLPLPAGMNLKYMEGTDSSWGYQLGAAWQINENNRIGIAYKSEVTMDFEGHAEGFSYNPANPTENINGKLSVPLPASLEIASFHQLNDKWAVHGSFNWTQWSKFEKLVAELDNREPDLIKEENWKDSYRFAVGTTYSLNKKVTLRGGLAYDMSAVDDKYRTTTIPETDRTWLSAGASYAFTKQFTLDGGLTYIMARTASINEPRDSSDDEAAAFGDFTGEISGDVWIVGIQANYRF
ncbi:aromatic hydrocarbon degradation protein [Vibrio sp. 10N.286.49.C2]|uniref:outer membrane protein transport protein n=1 Tax=unclassified Vibrio TaxID=2614977 RepID=UPI000C833D25|nr:MULTISPECIES: outer membrane protein transport protein [unclassified Vibrio]PMH39657.1 aromatic hydrocarbon degradation protein [Vibrio sp. 10N.286.49.C2]PMH57724.1 aromatic hydrocarbon degradation protein [Vibrio sp. 10N.286.49.B1]PMH82728.1 aromatic hydrocarbon degradation protein [Vibrio sp. 10N.286.48.B7]